MPVGCVLLLLIYTRSRPDILAASDFGHFMLTITLLSHGILMFAIAPVLTGGSFSREKREKSFPILLLAAPSATQIYIYKFIGAFTHPVSQILATLPLVLLGAFFAGVDYLHVVEYYAVLVVALAAITTAGLLASLLATTPANAVAFTYVILGILTLLSYLIWRYVTPLFPPALWSLGDMLSVSPRPVSVASVFAYYASAACIFAAITIGLIPVHARTQPSANPRQRARRQGRWTPTLGERFFLSGPRPRWSHGGGAGVAVLVAVAFIPIAVVPFIGTIVVALAVTYDIATRYDGARSAGEIEELVLTTLDDAELTRSFYRASLRASTMYIPAFLAGSLAFPLVWGTGGAATTLVDIFPATSTIGHWVLMICVVVTASCFGVAKYLLAATVAVRVAMTDLPFATRCCIAIAVYMGLLAAASTMSALLPFAFTLYEQLASGTMPSPTLALIHTLLATPLAAALVIAATIAVASETRTRQPWSRDYSFNQ